MTAITDYSEAVRDTRNALRYYKQTRSYTKSQFEAWGTLAQLAYPDTSDCLNSDLRNAFVHGCLMGYEFALVLEAPRCYDRLQGDAFMAGVVTGEDCWSDVQEDNE